MIELNKIYLEDCLIGMQRIADKSVDMILCDLPYGTTACKWDTIIPFDALWQQYERIIKDNGAIVLTASQPFTTAVIASNMKLFKYCWVWEKTRGTGHLNSKKMPLKNHEDIMVFYKMQPQYNPQMLKGKPYKVKGKKKPIKQGEDKYTGNFYRSDIINEGSRFPLSVISFNSESSTIHPTQKPVALFEYLIKTYTNEGETVLDNCMGSGTTAIACINTDRNYIGFEMDATYYALACERIRKHTEIKQLVPIDLFNQAI